MELHWSDVQRIAEELYDADPDLDPLTLSFVKLHDMVVKLPDFAGRSAEVQRANPGGHSSGLA